MNLADPELELIDPTPNIHSLFMHFDKLFFWTKLASRTIVRWSKRMYSCAGVCSYEFRAGLCNIALSEPLLKLRPRKDLIETLLHEMIHAYLFVTCKDDDRDGHGPNFKFHMNRINKLAGVNITIYHSFHDEVELYQTHWWRCNGPCQREKPFFGIVRRSCNRQPGPSDYWWKRHQQRCGGTFIKIKEPEKKNQKGNKEKAKSSGDITKFINNNTSVPNKNQPNKIPENSINKNTNIKKPDKPILKDSNNIVKSNGAGTLVVTKTKNVVFNPKVSKSPEVFTGIGHTLSSTTTTNVENITEKVRNIWANKQLIPTSSINNKTGKQIPSQDSSSKINTINSSKKHKVDSHIDSPPPKIKKIDDYFKNTATSVLKDVYGQDFSVTQNNNKIFALPIKSNLVDCPICQKQIESTEINRHLDECLNKEVIETLTKHSIVPEKSVSTSENDALICKSNLTAKNDLPKNSPVKVETVIDFGNIDASHSKINITPINSKARSSIDNSNYFKTTNIVNTPKKSIEQKTESDSNELMIPKQEIIDKPGAKQEKDFEFERPKIKSEPEEIGRICPCCGKHIVKMIEEHLDECLAFFDNNTTIPEEGASTSLETIVIDDDEDMFDETLTLNATGTKTPCPCCMKMVEQMEMNDHLDVCLISS